MNYSKRNQGPREKEERDLHGGSRVGSSNDSTEGKPAMLFYRKESLGALRAAGRTVLASVVAVMLATNAGAQNQQPKLPDDPTLEDLMNQPVTSVAKKPQRVADAAAAVFVITQEDIRRSGAQSVPEALRMAPGLEVARIDENKWAIGSRGFNGRFADKLLVLLDGRSVYTPLFSGVYWNVQDVLLEDIDRIEVIRGPGATLWGANAVNGVINIITKKAKDTQKTVVTAGGGTEERGIGGVRYGNKIGNNTYYRAYGKYFNWGPSEYAGGIPAHDSWDAVRGGFRADWTPAGANSLTLQGDIYHSRYNETLTVASLNAPYSNTFPNNGNYSGGNLLGRWNRKNQGGSTSLQLYFDNKKG